METIPGNRAIGANHRYQRHQPENTSLYPIVEQHLPSLRDKLQQHETSLPSFVLAEFHDYLRCGRLEHGFLRVKCNGCRHEHLVAFSCKRRGFCPSCGARRMIETSAHLVDHVLPHQPCRQWVLSFPWPLRLLFASQPRQRHCHSSFLLRSSNIQCRVQSTTTGSRHNTARYAERFHTAGNTEKDPLFSLI